MIRKWIKKLLALIIREVLREEETRIKEEAHQCVLETLGKCLDEVQRTSV